MAAFLLAGLLLAGCDDPPDGPPVVVRDSLGIRILEVDPDQVGEWARFDPEPEWVLGDGVSAGGMVLRGVSDASMSEAEEFVWIAERGSHALIGVDLTSGDVVHLGGAGDGPGDFRGLSRVWALEGGRVGAFDWQRQRYVELGDGTAPVRSQPLGQVTEAGASPRLYRVPIPEGVARLYLAVVTGRSSEWVEGRHRGTGPLVLLHEPPDTLTWIPGTVSFVAERVAGAVMFGATTLLAEGWDGIWVGDSGRPEVALWQVGREPTRIVRWRAAREPVTQELETRARALIREAAPDDPFGFASIVPLADSLPFFEVLLADPEGAVWITPYLALPDSPWPEREWLVFDSEAGTAGWVTTPEAFRPLRVGRDYILGIHRDVLDVETVRLHRLRGISTRTTPDHP